MRWLAFGTYDVGRHPRVGVLIEGLRTSGDEVVEVNAPLDLDTAARVQLVRQPWRIPLTAARLAGCWLRLIRQSRGIRADAILVGYLGHFDVRLARLLFRRTPIVLDHLVSLAGTAGDRGLAGNGGMKHRLLAAIDSAAIRVADVVIVDTEEHACAVTKPSVQVVVVPVGAESDWFAARDGAASDAALSDPVRAGSADPLRVVFFGLFTALQGTTTVGAALARLADDSISVTMVGTGQDYQECRRLAAPNTCVTWLDWVPRAELPALVASHDVCLGIFGTTEKSRNVVPTKVYQGAAAGLAIVTSDTSPQRRMLGDAASFVPAGDPEALARRLRELAADRAAVDRHRSAAVRLADVSFEPSSAVAPLRERVSRLLSDAHHLQNGPTSSMTRANLAKTDIRSAPLAPRAALRWDVVRRSARDVAPGSILEIGCGMGAMGMRLARMADYTAVEPDDQSFAAAHARITPLGGTVIHGDHTQVPADTQYDLVCAFEVLEHLSDDAGALDQWLPLVKPGGHLLLSVPSDPERFGPWDTAVGHYRRYSADQLAGRLTEAGAVDIRVTHYAWPIGYPLESLRNFVAQRRGLNSSDTPEDRSSGSGRSLQPSKQLVGAAIQLAVFPWALVQRLRTDRGPGVVALSTRPTG